MGSLLLPPVDQDNLMQQDMRVHNQFKALVWENVDAAMQSLPVKCDLGNWMPHISRMQSMILSASMTGYCYHLRFTGYLVGSKWALIQNQ